MVVQGQGYTGEEITVRANAVDGWFFKGWYNSNGLINSNNPYTFPMPAKDYSLMAVFCTEAEADEQMLRLGALPVVNSTDGTVTYGLYPQTRVSDKAIIAQLNDLTPVTNNGWYCLNDEYYAKTVAKPYGSSTFDSGKIVHGTEYWFKCEPIEWKILFSSGGEYSLISNFLLDVHRYNESFEGTDQDGCYSNNYANSEIREWLNCDFYKAAFSFGDSFVSKREINNSAITTDSDSNVYACANTVDSVSLLSYQEYENVKYFADATMKRCKTTDWARAGGAYADTSQYGSYWTRSPLSSNSDGAWYVHNDGGFYDGGSSRVDFSIHSIRPSLSLKIN